MRQHVRHGAMHVREQREPLSLQQKPQISGVEQLRSCTHFHLHAHYRDAEAKRKKGEETESE